MNEQLRAFIKRAQVYKHNLQEALRLIEGDNTKRM